jgi:trehalose 6-phosphate phosphatase
MTRADLSALELKTIGLFLDVDGTVVDIAPAPDEVDVPASLREDLAAANHQLDGALALLSGRPIRELDQLFAPLRLRAGGTHGAEIRYEPDAPTETSPVGPLPQSAWDDLQRLLRGFPGIFAENKAVTFAVHYRGADATGLLPALRRFLDSHAALELELVSGRRVFELKLPGFDKGAAIERFMSRPPFAGRMPVFIADDKVDQPGFDAALALGGMAFSVGFEQPGLSGSFSRPSAVREWLGGLCRLRRRSCPTRRPPPTTSRSPGRGWISH